jgi:hypothetical protein
MMLLERKKGCCYGPSSVSVVSGVHKFILGLAQEDGGDGNASLSSDFDPLYPLFIILIQILSFDQDTGGISCYYWIEQSIAR